MSAACASSPASPPPAPSAIVETTVKTRTVCPAELGAPVPAQPKVPAGAKITANSAGTDWLKAVLDWGAGLSATLNDAKTECAKAQ